MSTALEAHMTAVRALYACTAGDAPRGAMHHCPCGCIDDADARALQAGPREAVAREVVGTYAFKAMTTWGEPSDFRFFLPRVLELLAAGSVGAVDPVLLARKTVEAGLAAWPADVRHAVQDAFFALFDVRLERSADDMAFEAAVTVGVDAGVLARHLVARAREEPAVAEALEELVITACTRFAERPEAAHERALVDALMTTRTLAAVEALGLVRAVEALTPLEDALVDDG